MRQSIAVRSSFDGGVMKSPAIAAATDSMSIGSFLSHKNAFFIRRLAFIRIRAVGRAFYHYITARRNWQVRGRKNRAAYDQSGAPCALKSKSAPVDVIAALKTAHGECP